jgi:segregation and condensation protein B
MEENLEETVEATDQQAPAALEQTAETESETEIQTEAAIDTAAVETPAEVDTEALLPEPETPTADPEEARKLAILEAIVYVTDEPLTVVQMAGAMGEPVESIKALLNKLVAEYERPEHGLAVREVAGGYKMATKPEHHEAVRGFVKNLNPPLKLSLAALETLAVIAYKQPLTAPEIMEIRGVQGAGVLKTLIDRKLITTAGRKNVVGKPILYKTTKEFLVQFGLKDLNELPSLKEFEELRRLAFQDADEPVLGQDAATDAPVAAESTPEPVAEASTEAEPTVEGSTASAEPETPGESHTESETESPSEPRS